MDEPRSNSRSSDLADLDLTNCELYRAGFPHQIFTTLRRDAPVWWYPATSPRPKRSSYILQLIERVRSGACGVVFD